MRLGKSFLSLLIAALAGPAFQALANPVPTALINEFQTSPTPRVELHQWPDQLPPPRSLDGWSFATSQGVARIDSGLVMDSLSFLTFDSTNLMDPLRMNPQLDTLKVRDNQGGMRDIVVWPRTRGPDIPPPLGWSTGILFTRWFIDPMTTYMFHWYNDPSPTFGEDNRSHLGYITGAVRNQAGQRIYAYLHAFSDSGQSFSFCSNEGYSPYLMAVPRGTYRVWAIASGYDSAAYASSVVVNAGDTVHNVNIVLGPSGVEARSGEPVVPLPQALKLEASDPARGKARVSFELTAPARVALTLYDLNGRRVRTLLDENRGAGRHSLTWDGKNESGRSLSSGSYFLRLDAGDRCVVRKITLLN